MHLYICNFLDIIELLTNAFVKASKSDFILFFEASGSIRNEDGSYIQVYLLLLHDFSANRSKLNRPRINWLLNGPKMAQVSTEIRDHQATLYMCRVWGGLETVSRRSQHYQVKICVAVLRYCWAAVLLCHCAAIRPLRIGNIAKDRVLGTITIR